MRRYIFDKNIDDMEHVKVDVAIVGSGLAGLYTAHHLDSKLDCVIFTKERAETSASSLAQGGIAAVTEEDDRITYHYEDTMRAGAGLCDEQAVRTIVREGPDDIQRMLELGAHFDMDKNGHLITTLEGGHQQRRILHAGGDATGREMVRALKQSVAGQKNVRMYENTFVADILTGDDGVCGLVVSHGDRWLVYECPHVVLSSGGTGQVYRYTTNPSVATGDGMAMGARAGAKLKHMEFVQFHPTGLYTPEDRNKQSFLISEAVRGEGGILLNETGQRFMVGRHELAELAPRDIVAREIYREIQKQSAPYVKLDITQRSREYLQNRFPTIYKRCMEKGIDIATQFIPVGPLQHYMMGGIETDLWGGTNIKGLSCCGEAACTGVHGANRLASNSTLECLVFGRRSAAYINDNFREVSATGINIEKSWPESSLDIDIEQTRIDIKGYMVKYCGIVRNGKDMLRAIGKVKAIIDSIGNRRLETVRAMELYNMAQVSLNILQGAEQRKKSIGAHYREDE